MPIDRRRYPKNWRLEIRPRILARDEHHCRCCGLANHLWGYRDGRGTFRPLPEGRPAPGGRRAFRILLNVVHLDHQLTDHSDANLGLMCQRCHARYDKPVTAPQAGYTNKYPGAAVTGELFGAAPGEERQSVST